MDEQSQASLDTVLALMGAMGNGDMETKLWENEDFLASGDTAAVFGRMNARMTQFGKETGEFTFALRAKVRDGQVVLWNWFEDSFAISAAYSNNNA